MRENYFLGGRLSRAEGQVPPLGSAQLVSGCTRVMDEETRAAVWPINAVWSGCKYHRKYRKTVVFDMAEVQGPEECMAGTGST